MANFVLSEPAIQHSPRATSSPQSSPKMSSRSPFATKVTGSRPIENSKPRHLSELAMPSPVSTPGAEHLSDLSSCCSVDDTDSNRSSPPGSPTNPPTINSFSTPASDLKRKYKLWSTIRSDYHYLMDEEIIETCRSTESDLSFESDDQTASVAVVSFKDFMQQYNELSSWLGTVQQKAKRQSSCLSEKYVNQAFHEDMLNHMLSLKLFKDYAKQLTRSHPRLKDDIALHLKQVNGMWEALERLLLPNGNHSDQRKMLHDMELDFDGLRQWVDDMEIKRRTWRLHSHWSTSDIDKQLDIQRMLQAQVELHSRVVRALLVLCNRLTTDRDDDTGGGGLKVSQEDHSRAVHLKDQVTDIEEELNVIWLNSLEWQMTLEEAKKNGIHIRRDAEDDQWDRARATVQRKQMNKLQTMNELSSDFSVGEDDSFFHNHSLRRKNRINSEDESEVKGDDADVPVNERSTNADEDDYGVPEKSYHLQVPVDRSCRSYSDPLLTGESCNRMHHGGANNGSAKATQITENAEISVGNQENDFSREWSPGQLRRYGAIDLMAAFGEDKKEATADVGYSSGSHSNEDTDSSARQALFVWPQNKQQPDGPQIYANEAVIKENFLNSVTAQYRNATAGKVEGGESCNLSDRVFDYDSRNLEAADEVSLPETEDEMSVELPLDDVPVVQSDLHAAELCGPLLKRASAKMAVRRNLRFLEDSSTSDFDSWSQAKAGSPKSSPKKKHGAGKLETDPKMSPAEKTSGGKRQKSRVLCSSTPLSGSCYASSEGTESESDFAGHNLPIEKQERKFGCRLRSRWKGSSSLRSSPVKEVVEMSAGRSPLKRRMSENIESVFCDRYDLKLARQWMSDSAISELLREDALSPNKIPKMSFLKTSDCLKSGSLMAFLCSSKRLDDFTRSASNDGHDAVNKKLGSSAQGNIFNEPIGRVLQHSSNDLSDFLGGGEDAIVPNCDSLNSSLTELTSDDYQMYNSDYEKMGEEEMQWHDDGYLGNNFEGEAKKSVKDHNMGLQGRLAMDSDSDVEDFRHVLNESGKGLKFIETMIRQDYRFGENAGSIQDPSTFNEPLATCQTNIVCLQELIDALRSKNKLDGEILQVTEIVSRWQQLQSTLLLLQKESQRIFEFQAEVNGIQMELQNLNTAVEFDNKFRNIRQLEEAVKAVKAVQFEMKEKTDLRLKTLDVAYEQFVSERGDLDPQLFALGEQVEQLKKCKNSFSKRCELDERKLTSALISWHKFNCMEKELNSLLQSSDLAADAEELDDLEVMKKNWKLLDEKLQQLSLVYLDFANVCSDSSALALKQAITLSSSQLQVLRRTNDDQLIKLVNAKRGSSFPEEVGHQVAATTNSQASAKGGNNASPVNSTGRPMNYVLPVTLTFVLISCLYALFGDSWYELVGTLGLILDPSLKHVRGPPPS